MFSNDTGNAVT